MPSMSLSKAFMLNFLGKSPTWYKIAILSFLIIMNLSDFLHLKKSITPLARGSQFYSEQMVLIEMGHF